jgi:hypothetical protein
MPVLDGALLLYCLGIRPNGSATRRPPTLTAAEVAEILRQAGENGISSLLYHRLMTVAPTPELPPTAMDYLRNVAMQSAAQSLQISRELAEILGAFRQRGILAIALKGAHLGQIVYGNPAMRTMGDLDVMVRRDRLAEAERVLSDLGYRPIHDPLELVDYTHHHHVRPLGKAQAVRIDLHWTIARPTAPFNVDLDGIWQRAVPARLAGVEALVLSPEDLLLHLCLHASFDHQFRLGLRACWDILEVVQHYRNAIDWERLVQRARQWGVSRYVYLTLSVVRELLAVDIPAAVITTLEPAGVPQDIVEWARRGIFTPEATASVSPSLGRLWTARRLRVKIKVLLESLCPPRRTMARIYELPAGSAWIYPYYPLRWADLLVRYWRRAWKLLRGDDRTHRELRAVSERTALNEWLRAPVAGARAARPH